MAKKIKIQHLYTQTGNTAPTGNDALGYGEIAIAHKAGEEAIFIKNGEDGEEVKFIPKKQIEVLVKETAGSIEGFNTHVQHKANNRVEYEGNNPYGHVKLVDGDLSGVTKCSDGEAAASYHTHGQYYSFLDSGKGLTTIIGSEENGHPGETGFAISDNTYAQITGATQTTTFNAHTGNTTIHITEAERSDWNTAANRINTFLDVETGATEALDSLHEIQEYLTGSGSSVTTLLDSLNNLTDTVSGNTDDITSLKGSVTGLQTDVQSKVETIQVERNLTATTSTDSGVKTYTITHTPAGKQVSEITATNDTTGLSFGSEFKIVDNIGYDANGHVVTGSTQTLKLPTIPAATISTAGIVSLKGGDLSTVATVVNGQAAASCHSHSQYVKFTDLSNNPNSDSIIISCGTY